MESPKPAPTADYGEMECPSAENQDMSPIIITVLLYIFWQIIRLAFALFSNLKRR